MNRIVHTLLVGLALLLTSCGGSLVAGIEGSGHAVAASGPVTAFGSIFINGVEYTTTGAQFDIDDQPGTESQLSVGEVVTVVGTVNADGKTGTASQVSFRGNVLGPVEQVDPLNRTLLVLGQTVLITASTVVDPNIHPADITGVKIGTRVEVSGFTDSLGKVVASRLQLAAASASDRVHGVIQSLNASAHKFQLNALSVDYGSATISGTLANGSVVDVQGSELAASDKLVASAVRVSPALSGEANSEGDVDGLITVFTSSADFVVDGVHVITNANTHFTLNRARLDVNVRVVVQGSFDSSGALVATSVTVMVESEASLRGPVQSLPASNTVMVLGVSTVVSEETELEDQSSLMLRPFHFSDLHVGDYVEVRGTVGSGGALDADILIRQNPEALSVIQGAPSNVSAPTFTVLGLTVTTNVLTQYLAANGSPLSAAQFFSQAPAAASVRVTGTLSSGSFLATQAQIQPQPIDE